MSRTASTTTPSATSPRIAIVGGGPGGLTLARVLATHGLAATLFELDRDADARPQGGSLDLHADTGLHALDLAGLRAGFERVARYEDQAARVYDHHGRLLHDELAPPARGDDGGGGGDRPEIDRAELRQLLLESLPAGTIRWGARVTHVELDGDGAVVHIDGRAPERFDLVVGADGTWSRVRPVLTPVAPTYTGVTFVELELDQLDRRHPALATLVGRGKIFALGDGKAMVAQRNARENLRIYVAQLVPESWARAQAGAPAAAIKAALGELLADWSPSLRALLDAAGDRALALPLYAMPIEHRWEHRRGATLLGDAAHVMSPFAGEGVNNAMRDAAELALAITDAAAGDRDAAIAGYEQAMFARVRASAIESAEMLELAMGDDAAARMAAVMASHRPGAASGHAP